MREVILFIFKNTLCVSGFHNWEISKWCKFKDNKTKHLIEEGFDRTCLWCECEQQLKRPKKYHPCKYVWIDK